MSQPGMGVLLKALSGEGRGGEFVQAAIGRTIASIELDAEANALRIRFADGSGISISDQGQSCCEHRYMTCDDDLSEYVGAVLRDVEVRDGPTADEDGDPHEQQFLAVMTDKGEFVCANHNEHNGYYGGFWLQVTAMDAASLLLDGAE